MYILFVPLHLGYESFSSPFIKFSKNIIKEQVDESIDFFDLFKYIIPKIDDITLPKYNIKENENITNLQFPNLKSFLKHNLFLHQKIFKIIHPIILIIIK